MKAPISNIIIGKDRQRKTFTKEGIDSLAISMNKHGQFHPLIVVRIPDDDAERPANAPPCDCGAPNISLSNPHTSQCAGTYYKLVSGERRLRAAQSLDWQLMEILEKPNATPLQIEEIELDENLQRENLPWQEEVAAKKRIWEIRAELYGETVGEAAEHVGISRGSLWEDARLAKVMEEVPELKQAKNKSQAMSKLRLLSKRMALEELVSRGSIVREGLIDWSTHVFLGDCVQIMKGWPNETIHCIITDPPYGIDLGEGETKRGNNHPAIYADNHYNIMEVVELAAREAFRVLKQHTHAYFFFDIKAYQPVLEFLRSVGFTVDPVPLIWAKNTPGQVNHPESRWASGYEACFFCRKGQRAILKQGQTNVLRFDAVPPGQKIHPVEKPTSLLRHLIETSTVPGEVVVDMFAGSGSLAEAAIQIGRNFMVCEQDPAFHAGIINRLASLTNRGGPAGEVSAGPDSAGMISSDSDDRTDEEDEDAAADIEEALARHRGA